MDFRLQERTVQIRSAIAIFFCGILLQPFVSVADDWPGLRGVSGDAHSAETGLAEDFKKYPPRVEWAMELGQGYSSFAVDGDRAFTQYQSALGQYVIALDIETGESIWQTRYDLPFEAVGIYPGPRSTPTIAAGRLFFISPDVQLGCLSVETGRTLWSIDLKKNFRPTGADFGYAASPLVLGNRVIIPLGGKGTGVVAFDVADGHVVWSSLDDAASYCTLFPISLEGKQLLVAYLENVAAILDAADGKLLWRDELSTGYDEHSAAPLYKEPYLIFSAPFRAGATAYRLSWKPSAEVDAGKLDLEYVWFAKNFSNDVSSSVIVGDAIYGFDLHDAQSKAHRPSRGEFRSLDVVTGEILWSTDKVGQASIVAVDGRLVMWNDKGELIVAQTSRNEYIEQARLELFPDEICWTSPAFANGKVFVRTQSRAACIDLRPPQDGTPVAASATIPVGSRRRNWQWLLGAEREHPFMRPMLDDYRDWFVAALLSVFLPATLIAIVVQFLLWRREAESSARGPFRVWCGLCLVLGVVATPILNRWGIREFLFTWPAALAGVFQWALLENATLKQHADLPRWERLRKGFVARIVDVGFVLICVGYFWALHRLSLPHEWVFLIGFAAAVPFCWKATQAATQSNRLIVPIVWSLLGFTAGYWSSVLYPTVRGFAFGSS
ncbi:MAG: PQQ-binding-like beta-propeller repeat protein [Planctomycetota bacterium]|nr:PQQ-binding-like beta-propeller repeat protein [Planctomycetota bacterium]